MPTGRPGSTARRCRPSDLRGKVVLVNFWTYTCINSLQALPYLRAWADRYGDRGLVVLGRAHAGVQLRDMIRRRSRQAIADLGCALSGGAGQRRRRSGAPFANSAWPAFYFVDADGCGAPPAARRGATTTSPERVIQDLLGEARRQRPGTDPITPGDRTGPQAAPDWADLASPETYAGYAKAGELRRTGRPAPGRGGRVSKRPARLAAERLGAVGGLGRPARVRGPGRGGRIDRLPLPCPRPAPGDGDPEKATGRRGSASASTASTPARTTGPTSTPRAGASWRRPACTN